MLFCLVVAASTHAVLRSDFQNLDSYSDITVTSVVNPEAPTKPAFELSLGLIPKIVLNGQTYSVAYVWGFWSLANAPALNAAAPNQNSWVYNESLEDVAGWDNSTRAFKLIPGAKYRFTYDAIETPKIAVFGLAVQLNLAGGIGGSKYVALTPEPSSLVAGILILGTIGAVRARRSRRG